MNTKNRADLAMATPSSPRVSKQRSFIDRWGAYLAVSFAMVLGFVSGSTPTPLYPLYQAAWNIPPSALSYIFTAYMAGVMLALLCLGRLSDAIGRFRVIVIALLLLAGGLLVSALAPSVAVLIGARLVIGIANGLLITAGAIALAESHPAHNKRIAAVTASMAITLGFGLGPVLGGAIGQLGIAPLSLPYLVLLFLSLCTLALAVRSRARLQGPKGMRRRISVMPQMACPDQPKRAAFLLACITGFATTIVVCLFASLVPPLLAKLLPWEGPIVVGLAFLLLGGASAAIQFVQRDLPPFKGMLIGLLALMMSVACLALGVVTESPLVFAAAMIFTGIGQGLGIMASMIIAGANAHEVRRSASMSTYFFASYTGATLPIIAVGLLADALGLADALLVFCGVMGCSLFVLAWKSLIHLHQEAAAKP